MLDKYIDEKLKAGEKVAFLAFTNREVKQIEEILRKKYPTRNTVNIVPQRMYNSTIFSEYIKKHWDSVKFIPTEKTIEIIQNDIIANIDTLSPRKNQAVEAAIKATVYEWGAKNHLIIKSWHHQYKQGRLTLKEFLDLVMDNMLQFEISKNTIKQSLLSNKQQEEDFRLAKENADFLISTIHSAKGLEFDNVVIIYKAKNDMSEENKRMYYVAFTRAMKSEYILAYDTVKFPKIKSDYDDIVEALRKQDAKAKQANTTSQSAI